MPNHEPEVLKAKAQPTLIADEAWFKENPDRKTRIRVASEAEVEQAGGLTAYFGKRQPKPGEIIPYIRIAVVHKFSDGNYGHTLAEVFGVTDWSEENVTEETAKELWDTLWAVHNGRLFPYLSRRQLPLSFPKPI
jgi:hypothetical protein